MINKKDLLNVFSLVGIQGSNALLPIVIYPIVLKRIGSVMFSKLTITETISAIVLSFVMYSFDINGVSKLVGLNLRDDKDNISLIFSSVFYSRLLIFACILLLLPVFYIFLDDDSFYLLSFWLFVPLSNIFQSLWFFQGLELNLNVAIITLISRISAIFLILFFVNQPEDFIYIPIIVGCNYLLGGIISWLTILIKYDIKLLKRETKEIFINFKEGKEIFLGNISVILFRDLNVLLLGVFMVNPTSISIYSIAEKLIKGLQASVRPLNQLFFPKVISKLNNSVKPNKESFIIIIKQTIPQLLFLGCFSMIIYLVFLYVDTQTNFLENYPNKYRISKIFVYMNLSVFFGVLNFMLGSAGLNFLNDRKYFSTSIFIVGISSIISCIILIPFLAEYGAVFSFIGGEFLLLLLIVRRFLLVRS